MPSALELEEAVRGRGGAVNLFVEPYANHFAANRGFRTPGTQISQAVARMLGLV
jgi:hypothetical protein